MRGLLVAMLLLQVGLVAAQTGKLEVWVVDAEAGDPLPGATVVLRNELGLIRETAALADEDGKVTFPVLRVGGGYEIEVSFPGYAGQRLGDQRIHSGEVNPLQFRLSPEIRERVEVTAQRDVVDLEKTGSTTRFSDNFIEDLPSVGRFYTNILTLAPGVNDEDGDGNPNVHGARSRDFRAEVGGISNVDPLTGERLSWVNAESIEEIEVLTAGAGVEFGRAQGGFARILQKQGSNQFEGVFNFLYRSSLFDGSGANTIAGQPTPDFDWIQPSIQLSGPIIKDKLWYRLSHEYIDQEAPINLLNRIETRRRTQSINADQLTWQVSPRNKLAFQFQYDPLTLEKVDVSTTVPAPSSTTLETGGPTYSVKWIAPYSPRLLLETTAAYQDHEVKLTPTDPSATQDCTIFSQYEVLNRSRCVNTTTGLTSGAANETVEDRRQRFTFRGEGTWFVGRALGGTHQLKFGVVVENERYFRRLTRGPVIDPFSVEEPIFPPPQLIGRGVLTVSAPNTAQNRTTATNWAVYLEDQYKPRDNLAITVGLRVDRSEINSLGFERFDPEAEAASFLELYGNPNPVLVNLAQHARQIALRTFTAFEGLADLESNLAEALNVNRSLVQVTPELRQSAFWRKHRQIQGIHMAIVDFSPRLAIAWDPWSNGKTKFSVSAGRYYDKLFLAIPLVELEPISTEVQFTATPPSFMQRNPLLYNGTLGAFGVPTTSLVDRELKTPYQDEFTVSAERALWSESSIKLTYIKRNFEDQLQDIDLNHVNGVTQNPGWSELLLIGNFNTTEYEAWVLEFVRRFYRSWEMNASYVFSEAFGDAEDFTQQLGNIRSATLDERGFLSYDQRHVVRLNATSITPWGFRIGGSIRWESGLPYSVVSRTLFPYESPDQYLGLGDPGFQVGFNYPTGMRNDQRNGSFWNFDVRLAKEFLIGRGSVFQLTLEVFNLLNDDSLRQTDRIDGVAAGERRFGRQYQIGVRVAF